MHISSIVLSQSYKMGMNYNNLEMKDAVIQDQNQTKYLSADIQISVYVNIYMMNKNLLLKPT